VSGVLMADPRIVSFTSNNSQAQLSRAPRVGVHGRECAARRSGVPRDRSQHSR
jgi:hypothetical protein